MKPQANPAALGASDGGLQQRATGFRHQHLPERLLFVADGLGERIEAVRQAVDDLKEEMK